MPSKINDILDLLNRGEFNFNQNCVGLSADKSTVIYGAPWSNLDQGVVDVFIHDGTHWEHQSTLTASDGTMGDWFGYSVSLSADGSTALVGASYKSSLSGAAYIFTRSGSTWTEQSKLTASDAANSDLFGYSVSLSSDGSTALIGAYGKSSYAGAAYIFTKSGSTWTQQAKLTASDAVTNEYFGTSVSLSTDGSTALVGACGKSSSTGAAYVFTRSGSTWTQQAKLTASDAALGGYIGVSVSLSADGSCAAIEDAYGKVYVYTLRDRVWLEKPVKGNESMKLSQLTNINRSQFCIYIDNVQVREFTTHESGIDVYLWNDKKIIFEDQNLTSPVGTPEGAMMYNATDVDGIKVRVDVKTEKVAYEDELDL